MCLLVANWESSLFVYPIQIYRSNTEYHKLIIYYKEMCQSNIGQSIHLNQSEGIMVNVTAGLYCSCTLCKSGEIVSNKSHDKLLRFATFSSHVLSPLIPLTIHEKSWF